MHLKIHYTKYKNLVTKIQFILKSSKFIYVEDTLQQNVTTVTNFSEENFFVTKKYHIVTKFIFRH